jgi:hypothetical protein
MTEGTPLCSRGTCCWRCVGRWGSSESGLGSSGSQVGSVWTIPLSEARRTWVYIGCIALLVYGLPLPPHGDCCKAFSRYPVRDRLERAGEG